MAMIAELSEGLRNRYGEITLNHGPILNYLGMVLDFSFTGKARVTMSGYVDDVLTTSGIPGVSKTPATDWMFTVREEAVRLNTRCHLLALPAKVEKQLQATVSIQ